MFQRFIYEWKRSIPFFSVLFLSATLLWFFLRHTMDEGGLLSGGFILAVAFVLVASGVIYVVNNCAREFTAADGILTFLTPMAPWKIIMAKWLNFIVSFGLAFLLLRVVMFLFPLDIIALDGEGALAAEMPTALERLQEAISAAQVYGWINVPTMLLAGIPFIGGLTFVLFWSMVFTLGFWVLARTEAWFTSKGRRGKVIARVLMLFLGLVLLYAFLGILSEHVPLVLTTPGIRLIRAVRPAWGFLVSTPFEVTWTSKMDFIVGVPLSTVIALFVLTLLFLWMAQRAWKRIDR